MSGRKQAGGDAPVKQSIRLSAEAKKKLDEFTDRYGERGPQMTALSRLVEWFAVQPDWMKQYLVGWNPQDMVKPYAAALREMADQLDGKAEEHVLHLRTSRPPKQAKHAET